MPQFELLVTAMQDGRSYSAAGLVSPVGHRFSATKHVAEKQVYKFDKRQEEHRFEYRMVQESLFPIVSRRV